MNNDNFLKNLKNPDVWFDYAFAQKMVADKLLVDVIMKKDFLLSLRKESNLFKYTTLWSNALYHYGIGIENGLKGVIVKNQPDLVNFEISGDDVILHDIGGKASKNHDLYSLANRAGLLDGKNKYRKGGFGGKITKNVLHGLSDMIRWAARYPLPNNSAKVFRIDDDVPSVCVYGFHILDVICPIFDYFKSMREPGKEAEEDYLQEYLNGVTKKAENLMRKSQEKENLNEQEGGQ